LPKTDRKFYALIAVTLVGIIAICSVVVWYTGFTLQLLQDLDDEEPTHEYAVSLPVEFTVSDKYAGSYIATATVTWYDYNSKEQLGTGTTDANGIKDTSESYMSGSKLYVKMDKSNALLYEEVTVPKAGSTGQTKHYIDLEFYTFGSWSFICSWDNGTSITTGGYHNVTTTDYYPSVSVTIREATNDAGTMDFYDPIYGWNRISLFYFKVTGTASNALVVQNVDLIYQVSATERYYGFTISANEVTRDLLPNGQVKWEGRYSFSVNFDCTGIAAGNDWTVENHFDLHSNLDRFSTYGSVTGAYTSTTTLTYHLQGDEGV
jgi:hypothetical protein